MSFIREYHLCCLQRKHESVETSDLDSSVFVTPAHGATSDIEAGVSEKKHKKKHKKDKHAESQPPADDAEQVDINEV